MDFDDLLTAAETAPVPSRTVSVCINPDVAVKRADLLDALEQARSDDAREAGADQRLSAAPPVSDARTSAAVAALEDFDKEVQKSLVTLRFARLGGEKWALLTSAHPMRIEVPLDQQYGYNYDAVTSRAARMSGVRIDDAGEHELTAEQWERLMRVISGHDVAAIRDVVWTLNEWDPQQHVDALVKGFGAA